MGILKKLKSSLGKISLKRKVGGTKVGNFIRGLVHKGTGGVFGNGGMMLREGETPAEADNRMIEAAGAGLTAASQSLGVTPYGEPDSPAVDSFKTGVKGQIFQKYGLMILGGIAALFGLIFLFKRKKRR